MHSNNHPSRFASRAAAVVLLAGLAGAGPADADIDVRVAGPAGEVRQSLPDSGGAFDVNMPLARNAVNAITVSASDAQGNHELRAIEITQVALQEIVVAEIRTEVLSIERVEALVTAGVINLEDPENYHVSQFDIILTIHNEPVSISIPIVRPIIGEGQGGSERLRLPPPDDPASGKHAAQPPVEVVLFEEPVPSAPGQPAPPPIPGVLIIEGRIKSLKEFYSVRLLLMNTSGIFTLSDVSAAIAFPDGGLSATLPADGVIDFGEILPGDGVVPGQKEREFIIRGDEIGVRGVRVAFGGSVTGPGISEEAPLAFQGAADTSVEVKGPPTFLVEVAHPDRVDALAPYELQVKITNTGDAPALYASIALDVGADAELVECALDPLSGMPVCTPLEGSDVRPLGHILPGETILESFTVNPFVSGAISSCLGIADQNITLQVQAGLGGCQTGHFPPSRGVPEGIHTVSVVPAPNAQRVDPDAPVAAFFSERMNPRTITTGAGGSFNVLDAAGRILAGRLRFEEINERTVAIWQAAEGTVSRLPENAACWVSLLPHIEDRDGNPLFQEWLSSFATTSITEDVDPPTITLSVLPPVNPNHVLPGQWIRLQTYVSDGGSGVGRVELRMKDLHEPGALFSLVDQKTLFDSTQLPVVLSVDSAALTPGRDYLFKATAYDRAGNAVEATVAAVVAPSAAPPVIALPPDPADAVLHGISVTLKPDAIEGGIVAVRYYLDAAAQPYATVHIPPYQATLSTLGRPLGTHTIRAVAEDGLGQTGEDAYTFTLAENPSEPVIHFPNAVDGATFVQGALIAVTATAEDPTGIEVIEFYLDDLLGPPVYIGHSSFLLDSATLTPGGHRIIVRAVNRIGRTNDVADPDSIFDFVVVEPPPGDPPAAPTVTRVAEPEDGRAVLEGATAPNARVDVHNATRGFTATVTADRTGAYRVVIEADGGDVLEVTAYDFGESPNPSASTTVTTPVPRTVTGLQCAPTAHTLRARNASVDLEVAATYEDATTETVTTRAAYSSSAPQVASVNSAGRIVALANGLATITATYRGQTAQAVVEVDIVTLTALSVAPDSLLLVFPADSRALAVTGRYSDGSSAPLTSGISFATENPAVATVDGAGRVTAVGNGQTRILIGAAGVSPVRAEVEVDTSLNPPPMVFILAPADGTEVERNDVVVVRVRGADPTGGVVRLELDASGETTRTDSRQFAPTADVTREFAFPVDTHARIGGAITLAATAIDAGGLSSTTAVVGLTVVDRTAPEVEILAPANDTPYNDGDTIEIRVQADDSVGIANIRFATEGGLVTAGSTNLVPAAGPIEVTFAIPIPLGSPAPEVTIRAFAVDEAGNEGASIPVHILLTDADITPPETIATAVSDPGGGSSAIVSYTIIDGLDDLDHVRLYFRRNGFGTFNLYVDDAHPDGRFTPQSGAAGTILFDSTQTGGDGTYAFYTVGVDDKENREPPPAEPDQVRGFAAGTVWTTLSADTVLGVGDTQYDDANIRIDGAVLTVDGHHTFRNLELVNGATLTHPAATASTEPGIDLACWSLTVDSTSALDVSGRGYLGGWRGDNAHPYGLTLGNTAGSTYRSGGSYGGQGGVYDGVPNPQYGSLVTPAELGSGGSEGVSNTPGGNGGGRVRIHAVHVMHDGRMSTRGANGGNNLAGSGSGGSVYLVVSSFSGTGAIDANGAAHEVGGGGGRIAIHHVDMATYDTGGLSAAGGIGNTRSGGDGTVFLKAADEAGGTLVVDGQGAAASFSALPIPTGYVFDAIVLQNSARVVADDPLVVNRRLAVTTGSILTHSLERPAGLRIEAAELVVDATSAIDVSGRGYRGAWRSGNASPQGVTLHGQPGPGYQAGASYGGLGGTADAAVTPVYGDPARPVYLGSGGGEGASNTPGGNGGGRIEIDASERVVVEGAIRADGDIGGNNQAGSGAGGSVWIRTARLQGTGDISANGGAHEIGGGGGRVAIEYNHTGLPGDDLDGLRNVTAFGGHGNNRWGSAGTLLFRRYDQVRGDLVIDDNVAGASSTVWTPLPHVGFGASRALRADTLVTDGTVPLLPGALAGLALNPNRNQSRTFTILDNTATSIVVDVTGGATLTDVATVGDEYAAAYHVDNLSFRRGGFLVLGDALHVDGTATIDEYGVLTHHDATTGLVSRLEMTCRSLVVGATGAVNADGRGYLGGRRGDNAVAYGRTAGNAPGATRHSGASHGGLGGATDGVPNPIYGDLAAPTDLGAGGSAGDSNTPGGDGGGRIHIVAEQIQVDGLISAGGGIGGNNAAGSGAGGSVLLEVGSLDGAGYIRANGGGHEVGGGGGRIAVYSDTLGFDTGRLQALGGQGNAAVGGNGTIFLRRAGQEYGDLIIDGAGGATPFGSTRIAAGTVFDNLTLRNQARVTADDPLAVSNTLTVAAGSILTHSVEQEAGLLIDAGSVVIDATSSIDVSGRGYRGAWRNGNARPNGLTLHGQTGPGYRAGASYGGLGGTASAATNPAYGHPAVPQYLGTGGGEGASNTPGGNGGGAVRITARDTVRVDGAIRADGGAGGNNLAGSGAGGSIWIDAGVLAGNGTIAANGGAHEIGGGGGRIAVRYGTLGFDPGRLQALGGQGNTAVGGNGTVFLRQTAQLHGDLLIDGLGVATPDASTPLPDGLVLDNLLLRNQARVQADHAITVQDTLSLVGGSLLTHATEHEPGLALEAAVVTVDATSRIDVSGRGYRGGWRDGNSSPNGRTLNGQTGAGYRAGGSYGGLGGTASAAPSPVYGHPALPQSLGGGGGEGASNTLGGNGGGRIDITATSRIVIDGAIRADGAIGGNNQAGSGSGGSIWIRTGRLEGAGTISANGGAHEIGAGGGRVRIDYAEMGGTGNDLDGLRQLTAFGGHGNARWGSAGTIVLRQSAQPHGTLVIDDNLVDQTTSVQTPLTRIGFGASRQLTADTLVPDQTLTYLPGALAELTLNPNLAQDAVFTIIGNTATSITVDVSGGITLTDVAAPGDPYAAVYAFDSLVFRRGGLLAAGDQLLIHDTLAVTENGMLTHMAATARSTARLEVFAGSIVIAADGRIDAGARGYLGGWRGDNASPRGLTLGNLPGSTYRSGGSYGGLGGVYDGTPNPVYGRVTDPAALGSGGSEGSSNVAGGDGGGWVRLVAGSLRVDGSLGADGNAGAGNLAGSGSGGTIHVETGALTGTGVIHADGGAHEVGGGGGRIALYYPASAGDSSQLTIRAAGGVGNARSGEAGSVYLDDAYVWTGIPQVAVPPGSAGGNLLTPRLLIRSLEPGPGGLDRLTWSWENPGDAVPLTDYLIEYTDDLLNPDWTPLANPIDQQQWEGRLPEPRDAPAFLRIRTTP